ncbi:MAG: hypothetical protein M3P84_00515 [Chloroflexota bacterium]|nr:hypothetical protein [Chloroflexota bacterium]
MLVPRDTLVTLTPDGDLVPDGRPGTARVWPFTQSRRFVRRSRNPRWLDPINLMVLRTTPAAIIDLLASMGWLRPGDGATHRTWIDGGFRRMNDHTALGSRAERVHIRVFQFGEHTLIGAHHEVADGEGPHRVTSWDHAREVTSAALEAAGATRLTSTGIITPPNLRGVPGDGRVERLLGPGG